MHLWYSFSYMHHAKSSKCDVKYTSPTDTQVFYIPCIRNRLTPGPKTSKGGVCSYGFVDRPKSHGNSWMFTIFSFIQDMPTKIRNKETFPHREDIELIHL